MPKGMSNIKPVEFVDGSRELLDQVSRAVRNYYKDRQHILDQWAEWEEKWAPKSDDVHMYVSR